METLLTNATGKARESTYLGRDFLVVPIRMLVSGVLNGSKGPIFYPEEEISRNPSDWNGIPIVLPNHPTVNGETVSARHPQIMDKWSAGFIYNCVANKSLDGEAWIDVERANRIDNRIVPWLKLGKKLEISTGLFPSFDKAPEGSIDSIGRPYSWIARNFRPDHVAILPDQKGACSIKDGCGILVNNSSIGGNQIVPNKAGLLQKIGEILGLVTNEPSHFDVLSALNTQLCDRFGPADEQYFGANGEALPRPYVVDVYDDYVIYSFNNELYRLDYTVDIDKETVTLSGSLPVEVQRITQYKSVNNSENLIILDWHTGLVANAYPSEHAARMVEPDKFLKNTFRRKEIGKGISIIMGKMESGGPMMVQSYRFNVKYFTAEEAKGWLKSHKLKPIKFEPASTSTTTTNNNSSNISQPENKPMPLDLQEKTRIVGSLVANCDCAKGKPWEGMTVQTLNSLDDSTLTAYDQWNKSLPGVKPVTNSPNPTDTFIDVLGNSHRFNPVTNRLELVSLNPQFLVNNQQGQQNLPVAQPVLNQSTNNSSNNPVVGNSSGSGNNPVTNSNRPKPMSELLQYATPEDRAKWVAIEDSHRREKENLVSQLVANSEGEVRDRKAAIYSKMELNELRDIAADLNLQQNNQQQPVVNYLVQSAGGYQPPVQEEPLTAPVYDFSNRNKRAG